MIFVVTLKQLIVEHSNSVVNKVCINQFETIVV